MRTATLRKSGGSVIMAIPKTYVVQNHLDAGSKLVFEIAGDELRLKPAKARKSLAELLAATPAGLQRADGWDEMPAAGDEA